MQILSLQPYYGGSHKYVMNALQAESRHNWRLLTLPPRKWQWRMQHAGLSFAEQLTVDEIPDEVRGCQTIFCSDMLNLAEFRGLAPAWAARLPAILYFHENQFAYPARNKRQQRQNEAFGFINIMSACAAEEVWFNSAHNRDSFFEGIEKYLQARPDCQPWDSYRRIREKSRIVYPGIYPPRPRSGCRSPGPLRIVWAARWEYDKGPELFFDALQELRRRGVDFRLRMLGERFSRWPPVFDEAAALFKNEIDAWGYEPSTENYQEWLRSSDVIVSTAIHEFFGISILEGAAAGAVPVLPNKLSYPELFGDCDQFFYDGTVEGLVERLQSAARYVAAETENDAATWEGLHQEAIQIAGSYNWEKRIEEFDRLTQALHS